MNPKDGSNWESCVLLIAQTRPLADNWYVLLPLWQREWNPPTMLGRSFSFGMTNGQRYLGLVQVVEHSNCFTENVQLYLRQDRQWITYRTDWFPRSPPPEEMCLYYRTAQNVKTFHYANHCIEVGSSKLAGSSGIFSKKVTRVTPTICVLLAAGRIN